MNIKDKTIMYLVRKQKVSKNVDAEQASGNFLPVCTVLTQKHSMFRVFSRVQSSSGLSWKKRCFSHSIFYIGFYQSAV